MEKDMPRLHVYVWRALQDGEEAIRYVKWATDYSTLEIGTVRPTVRNG